MNKSKRGFASMDPIKANAIRSKGGKRRAELGVGHIFTPEEAREAGRKGGLTTSQNSHHMAAIGRKGGASKKVRHG
jgi:general stress protein YciG